MILITIQYCSFGLPQVKHVSITSKACYYWYL